MKQLGFNSVYQWLLNELNDIEIIDAHEHLPPEHERTSKDVDVFTLFSHYAHANLIAAGMEREVYNELLDTSVDLRKRWESFKPYYEAAKYTSYLRAARIALKEFYGESDISDANYEFLSEKIRKANQPGIYKHVLKDKCHIRAILTQIGYIPKEDRDLLIPILPLSFLANLSSQRDLNTMNLEVGVDISNLDDYLGFVSEKLEEWKRTGVVGLKLAAEPVIDVSKRTAMSIFGDVLQGDLSQNNLRGLKILRDYLTDEIINIATEHGFVISVHSGIIWTNWRDYTLLKPTNLIPLLIRHKNAKFDVYHAGIPWVRETGVMGKTFPNIWLNLCWCHVISQEMTCSALNEWIDLVPTNKIIGFGGDYGVVFPKPKYIPVEKVYGHLVMAKEDIGRVLAQRVAKKHMSKEEALNVARSWLYDNPRNLYSLSV